MLKIAILLSFLCFVTWKLQLTMGTLLSYCRTTCKSYFSSSLFTCLPWACSIVTHSKAINIWRMWYWYQIQHVHLRIWVIGSTHRSWLFWKGIANGVSSNSLINTYWYFIALLFPYQYITLKCDEFLNCVILMLLLHHIHTTSPTHKQFNTCNTISLALLNTGFLFIHQ